ncbi:MAG: 4-alpha-glucanotransferase [Oscillospiraceae bacterium]|nr:4-alpha-glucanotransferase [Oscillospiraceae bacterium]
MRKSGILLAVSSLPSKYGIGTLGKSAYDFIDFLKKSGQYYWQILPINPTSFGNSPYQSFSAFAFNPYFIDLEELIKDGLLTESDCDEYDWGSDSRRVDYSALYENRPRVLKKAVSRFHAENNDEYRRFCHDNSFWLEDYAFFMALKEKFGMRPLTEFPLSVRVRDAQTLNELRAENQNRIEFHKITQFLFYRQWINLKKYANYNGVHIIGDIPIYVSADSADVWAHPELFCVSCDRIPQEVAGCPPDDFSPDGQLWGNPVYDWNIHKKDGYGWWIRRLRQAAELFDTVRIDHFRGFYSFYCIKAGAENARNGEWKNADGESFISAVRAALPELSVIAEDLGFITDDIRRRMASSGFPGMKILQFAFTAGSENEHLPHNYSKNSVVYTGTHDNDTTTGWQMTAPRSDIEFAMDYFDVNFTWRLTDAFIKSALSSVCDTAIIPMQDYLKQGKLSRMNIPSTLGDNWIYRIEYGDIDDNLVNKIYRQTKLYSRL